MRILPVTLNHSIQQTNINRRNNIKPNIFVTQPLPMDTVSFKRSAGNGVLLRKLVPYAIPDMYTGQILLDGNQLEEWLQKGVFKKTIKNVVKNLRPYKETLHKSEKQVFEKLEDYAIANPEAELDAAIKNLAIKAKDELTAKQFSVFEELEENAQKLPPQEKAAFKKLIEDSRIQIKNNQPKLSDFSRKAFRYKLSRAALEVKQRGIEEEINAIDKLMSMSEALPAKNKIKTISRANHSKKVNSLNAALNKQAATTIKRIRNYFAISPLRENKDVESIIIQAKNQIEETPTLVHFSRKTFVHELEKITNSIENQKYAHRLTKIAQKLPTSHQEVSAFLVKEARFSPEKIGYDLFAGSIATLDHLVPFSKGGKDAMTNYGLTSHYNNSVRGNKDFSKILANSPEIYENCQKQIDKLIELSNNGTFAKIGLSKYYILNLASAFKKYSPEDKPLIVNLEKLK